MRSSRLVLVVAGCLTLLGIAAPAHAAEPAVGTCWEYTAAALARPSIAAEPISCEGPHRAETFVVSTLPAGFPDPTSASVRQRADVKVNTCTTDRMNAYLGLVSTIPSRFRPVAVYPSSAEYAAGARWVRCDVVFDEGLGIGTMPKPAPAWVAENAGNRTAFAACTPGTGYSRVPSPTKTQITGCTDPNKQWILVSTPTIAKVWQKYPGAKALAKVSESRCKAVKNVYHGGLKDAWARGWWYIYPMAKGWNAGTRTTSCWVPLKQYLATP